MQYKKETIEFVERQVELGRKRSDVLKNIELSRSTYYSWVKSLNKEHEKVQEPLKPHLTSDTSRN